ncbi:MAG TPA: leucyl aminopeptidase, partial [Sphingopyxis sp.]|nr:leucyl aminopeptidase [Sphingopyxis sp.]
ETAAIDGDQAKRLLLVGIGEGSELDLERGGAALTAKLQTSGVTAVQVDFASAGSSDADDVLAFAMGALLRNWRLDTYRTRLADKAKPTLKTVIIASPHGDLSDRWAENEAIADGVALTQTLVAEPPNILYPESFVERCQHLTDLGVELEVLDERQMKALGMGALLGVAQGSTRPPRLLAMRWNGGNPGDAPVVFIGKGVTFDTGGISLKPGAGMDMMKWDMGGAGAVAGAIKAIAGRKAKANVVGVVGLVENMPDGNAMRPGDVVTTMSGQTVEVLNTDAEGRLVLCDAISWAQSAYDPKVIVDLATLTGAMVISLGHEYAGIFANDDKLAADLLAAGEVSNNKLWRFPLSPAYDKLIDSPIADMKNIGPREGGSITAAQFLKRYVGEGVAWAHLDIAGMAWADKDGPVWAKGATGYGVRLLDRYIAANHEG